MFAIIVPSVEEYVTEARPDNHCEDHVDKHFIRPSFRGFLFFEYLVYYGDGKEKT